MTPEQPPTSTPAFLPPVILTEAKFFFFNINQLIFTPLLETLQWVSITFRKTANTSPWPISPYIIWLQLISLTPLCSLHCRHIGLSLLPEDAETIHPWAFCTIAHSKILFPQTLPRVTSHPSELSLQGVLPIEKLQLQPCTHTVIQSPSLFFFIFLVAFTIPWNYCIISSDLWLCSLECKAHTC